MKPRRFKVRARTGANLALAALLLVSGVTSIPAAEPVDPKLTPRLRELLIKEMRFLLDASQDLVTAVVSGHHGEVARLAGTIHDSFILQQSLTEKDRQDLTSAVPVGFVELDRSFHRTAEKLAGAAKSRDLELERFYFSRLIEKCVACHARYVHDRFPGFSPSSP